MGEQQETESDTGKNRKAILARVYHVFNVAQIDGYDLPMGASPKPLSERIEHAEQFFGTVGAQIREGGSRAFYSPAEDYIQMPPFAVFKKADYWYSVLSHEVCHWTGAPTRLHRDLAPRFQIESYAAEELVAELGSAFLCAKLGLEIEPRCDHAPYIQSWLKALRSDKCAIFTAAAKAQEAVDWLCQKNSAAEGTAA